MENIVRNKKKDIVRNTQMKKQNNEKQTLEVKGCCYCAR